MGFTKWLFKNGFGSIGSTTKTWTKFYQETISGINHQDKKEKGFLHVIMSYSMANSKVRQYNSTDPTLLIEKSEGCLAMLMWILICEIPSNVKAILTNTKAFDDSNEVIYESVMEIAPHDILMTPSKFRIHALNYLDYCDNRTKVLETNNYVNEIKYRTAVTNKHSREMSVFEDYIFSNAKARFLSLEEEHDLDDFIIWTMEMNSNKYIYNHLSNDSQFQRNINTNAKNLSGKIKFPNID